MSEEFLNKRISDPYYGCKGSRKSSFTTPKDLSKINYIPRLESTLLPGKRISRGLADHVVRNRVLFPGAGYLEVGHAACCAAGKQPAKAAALPKMSLHKQQNCFLLCKCPNLLIYELFYHM